MDLQSLLQRKTTSLCLSLNKEIYNKRAVLISCYSNKMCNKICKLQYRVISKPWATEVSTECDDHNIILSQHQPSDAHSSEAGFTLCELHRGFSRFEHVVLEEERLHDGLWRFPWRRLCSWWATGSTSFLICVVLGSRPADCLNWHHC